LWAAVAAVVTTFGTAACESLEARQREKDRGAILAHVREMERLLRAHDMRIWLHVEGKDDPAAQKADPAREASHQAMLWDFERLGHLEGFAMADVRLELNGDTATVRYRVLGRPSAEAGGKFAIHREPVPAAGEIRFIRGKNGWEMVGHRLLEAR